MHFLTFLRKFASFLILYRFWAATPIKKTLLFQLLGAEGMRQFGNEPAAAHMDDDTLSFTAFCEAVNSFFQKPVKPARACLDLHNHCQGQHESRTEFVAALRESC